MTAPPIIQTDPPLDMANGPSPTPIPSDTDLFGTPSHPATPDLERAVSSDLGNDLSLMDNSVTDEEETGLKHTPTQVSDTDNSSMSSRSTDSSQ